MNKLLVTDAERDLIIAALRMWQRSDGVSTDLIDIALNDRAFSTLPSSADIDSLIEDRLNAGDDLIGAAA